MVIPANRIIPEYPYHIVWIATNACNARCVHCSTAAAKKLPGELETEEVKKLFTHLSSIGLFDVAISGGEPLTRPDLLEIIWHMKSLGLKYGVGSNGSTITKEKVRLLKEAGVSRLQISIDGTEELHDLARRWVGLYQKARNAILLGVEGGLQVNVCMTLHKLNYKVLEDVVKSCIEWGVKKFNLSRFIPTGRGDQTLDLPKELWKEMIYTYQQLKERFADRLEMTTHLSQSILVDPDLNNCFGFNGCQAGIGQGCIGPTGDVSPCVMLPVTVGNIKEHSFAEIWSHSPLIQTLKTRKYLKKPCGSCAFVDKCGGCRAVAYAYTHDVLEADGRCWLVN